MSHELIITPSGHLALLEQASAPEAAADLSKPLVAAFADSPARGLLHLATNELQARLPPAAGLCPVVRPHLSDAALPDAGARSDERAAAHAAAVRRGTGDLDLAGPADDRPGVPARRSARRLVDRPRRAGPRARSGSTPAARRPISARKTRSGGSSAASRCTWPRTSATRSIRSRSWRPMSAACRPRAASSTSRWARRCSNTPAPRTGKRCCRCSCPSSGRPSAARWSRSWSIPATSTTRWPGRRARRIASCRTFPIFEESGLIVRVPDWWKPQSPAAADRQRARSTRRKGRQLGVDALLDFSVGVTLDGEPLTEAEIEELLASAGGLVRAQGQVGRGRPRETGRGARALEDSRARRPRRAACPSSKGCACWPARRWSATRRRTCPIKTREWIGLDGRPGARRRRSASCASPESLGKSRARRGCAPSCGPISSTGVSWLQLPDAAGPGRLPGRRHGPGQDRSGDRPAARIERRTRGQRERGRSRAQSAGRAGLADRQLEGGDRAVRTVAVVSRSPIPSETPAGKEELAERGRRGLRSGHHHLRHADAPGLAATSATGDLVDPRRSPGDQELRHAADARRQGTAGRRPHRPDRHAGRESAVAICGRCSIS